MDLCMRQALVSLFGLREKPRPVLDESRKVLQMFQKHQTRRACNGHRCQAFARKHKLALAGGAGGVAAVMATAATHAVGTAAGYSGGAAILHGAAVVGGTVGFGAVAAPVVIGAAAVAATVVTVKLIDDHLNEEGGCK